MIEIIPYSYMLKTELAILLYQQKRISISQYRQL